MIANLFGDFVKGSDYSHLPPIVQEGVLLHREIDDFIDHHEKITELRLKLYEDLPKIASIAIDLYIDHLLAKRWSEFSNHSLEKFVDDFFRYALNKNNQRLQNGKSVFTYPDDFVQLLQIMHDKKWILRYQELEGLVMASTGLSRRISFENNLHEAKDVFLRHSSEIEAVFNSYMKDAQERFQHH